MNEEIIQRMITKIKNDTEELASYALELDVNWDIWETFYNEDDLMNVSLLFMHIMWNISAGHCLNQLWLDINQSSIIATESWENIRQTILIATWLDTHKLAKK